VKATDSEDTSDKFVDMVSATAEVDLRLSDFHPRSSLNSKVHRVDALDFR